MNSGGLSGETWVSSPKTPRAAYIADTIHRDAVVIYMTPEEDLKSHRLKRAGIERMLTIIGEVAGMRRLSTTTSAWTTKQYS